MDRAVTTWDQNLIDLIDSRIRAHEKMVTGKGFISSIVDATHAMVTFEGANSASPVRIFGDVQAAEGDLAVMVNTSGIWTVVGVYTPPPPARPVPGFTIYQGPGTLAGTVTSGSYVDFANTTTQTLIKKEATSKTICRMSGTLYVGVADTTAIAFGVRVDGSSDVDVQEIAATNGLFVKHVPWGREVEIPGPLSAGSHTFKARWMRTTGTGTGTVDGGDNFTMTIYEVLV
jgi:hypothetical protein